jgi:hypothetical protein
MIPDLRATALARLSFQRQERSSKPSSELPARIEISQNVGKLAGAMDQAAG